MAYKFSAAQVKECKQSLRTLMQNAQVDVYALLRSASRSNMTARYSFFVVYDYELRDITWYMAGAAHLPINDDHHIVMHGCGYDRAFQAVNVAVQAAFMASRKRRLESL